MKTLEMCENFYGKLSPQIKKRIKNFLDNPNVENWDDISGIIIGTKGGIKTIWTAIIELDPTFPKRGRSIDLDGNIVKDWERIPTPLQVLQAIKNSLSK